MNIDKITPVNVKLFTSSKAHKEYLIKELSALPIVKRLAFMAAICERILPLYNEFAKSEKWGDPKLLRTILDKIWESIVKSDFKAEEISNFKKACLEVTPRDLDDFGTDEARYAQYAGATLYETLNYYVATDSKKLEEVCELPIDTIDQYIQSHSNQEPLYEADDPDRWYKLWNNHPLLIHEQTQQLNHLELLKHQSMGQPLIQQLKDSSSKTLVFNNYYKEEDDNNQSQHLQV